jgi:hypothetical protein
MQVVVIGNIYFVDVFLGGEFSTYGIRVLNFLEAGADLDKTFRLHSNQSKMNTF